MRTTPHLVAFILICLCTHAPAVELENKHVEITIDVEHGGAITKMIHKDATSFDFIANRGARFGGGGKLFVPFVTVGQKRLNLNDVAMETGKSTSGLLLSADLSRIAPGLRLERNFILQENATRLEIDDTWSNTDKSNIVLCFGATSRLDGQAVESVACAASLVTLIIRAKCSRRVRSKVLPNFGQKRVSCFGGSQDSTAPGFSVCHDFRWSRWISSCGCRMKMVVPRNLSLVE